MKISGVAIGQWNQNCKNKEGIRRTSYKIHRAIVMGKVSHMYMNGDYIIRYHDLNLLISTDGIVMTVWRDGSTKPHTISQEVKDKYDTETTHKTNIMKANKKHCGIVKRGREGYEKVKASVN